MKKNIKTSLYVTAISVAAFAVFACSDANDEPNNSSNIGAKCKQVALLSSDVSYDNLDPSCKSEQKKLVVVSDLHQEEIDWDYVGGDIAVRMEIDQETGEHIFIVNGKKMSEEEFSEFDAERNKRYQEQLKGKRDLAIPCVVSDYATSWVALLTEQEISELTAKYGELAFRDNSDLVNETGACK